MAGALVLFDGVCNFCNAAVNFIMDRDPAGYFRFASLQSPAGQRVSESAGLSPTDIETFIVVEDGKVYTRSSAALRITKRLPGAWPLLYGFVVVPRPVRDGLYNLVARNRYRWFGKTEACRIPTPEQRSRFAEE